MEYVLKSCARQTMRPACVQWPVPLSLLPGSPGAHLRRHVLLPLLHVWTKRETEVGERSVAEYKRLLSLEHAAAQADRCAGTRHHAQPRNKEAQMHFALCDVQTLLRRGKSGQAALLSRRAGCRSAARPKINNQRIISCIMPPNRRKRAERIAVNKTISWSKGQRDATLPGFAAAQCAQCDAY